MSLWRHLTRGVRVLTRRTAADRDLDDEVQHYIDQAIDAHVARGLSTADALRAARREIGNATRVREQVRDYGWERLVGTVLADVRFAGRMLRKSPVFMAVVVFVISLGSGAVTTMFSAMNAVLLRPLPGVANPARLVSQSVCGRFAHRERVSISPLPGGRVRVSGVDHRTQDRAGIALVAAHPHRGGGVRVAGHAGSSPP